MKELSALMLLAMCLSSAPRVAVMDPVLLLDAGETIAKISPREQGRKETRVPDLSLTIIARFRCPKVATAESVTISIADTHKRFAKKELADAGSVEAAVTVPAGQIAPVASADFCIDGQPTSADLRVPGIATAHASLRCRSEAGLSVHYASTTLPLRLVCEPGNRQGAPALR